MRSSSFAPFPISGTFASSHTSTWQGLPWLPFKWNKFRIMVINIEHRNYAFVISQDETASISGEMKTKGLTSRLTFPGPLVTLHFNFHRCFSQARLEEGAQVWAKKSLSLKPALHLRCAAGSKRHFYGGRGERNSVSPRFWRLMREVVLRGARAHTA